MRQSGILLHITSLPGPEGIGTLGDSALSFIDFLADSGCGIWQMLPVGPTGYGNSPYQSPCCFAGDPLLIDLKTLEAQDYLEKGSVRIAPETCRVDYDAVRAEKETMLTRAFSYSFEKIRPQVEAFVHSHPWAEPFAQYQALCEKLGWFYLWPVSARRYQIDKNSETQRILDSMADRIQYHEYAQYLFDEQWKKLKNHAQERGILLFGDMPIYVAPGSADVWMHPQFFQLDSALNPTRVAGVPPDYFSADGQLWGNPLYNWKALRKDNYSWWIQRLMAMAEKFDIVRIDHFIGFANYYSIPSGAKTARIGKWVNNRGKAFFRVVKKELPSLQIIAEDLGAVNARVRRLLRFCGYPGMKVLLFGFSGDDTNAHRPCNIGENCVVYTGTHDNDTALGWWNRIAEPERKCAISSLSMQPGADICDALVRAAFASPAERAIVPIQDLLCLGNEARMNTPGTVGGDNWRFRLFSRQLSETLRARLRLLNRQYHRGK